jgi:hypothetical protein
MTRLPLRDSILRKILIVAASLLASAWVQTPAFAQHGGHPGGPVNGGTHMSTPRVFAPPASHSTISRHRVFAGPRPAGVGPRSFRFRQGPINVFRRRLFFGAPFSRLGWGFNSLWWPTCGPSVSWAWGWGFDCYSLPLYGYGFESYVTEPTYENPVYLYGGGGSDLIWLYLKDGTVYDVTDYWLVNGQMHFSMVEDNPTRPAEHVIPYDELGVQKTTYVNTRRGFRMVFRDEPWQQYLKDHPDLTPPDLAPPQKN